MRVILQRVDEASVEINGKTHSAIGKGLLILVGIEESDNDEDIEWLSKKIVNLRIFNDENNIMNLSVKDIDGEILIVSQFTLHALIKKGNRPSYIRSAKLETAIPIYEKFTKSVSAKLGKKVKTGVFGAHMLVKLVNNGPVTIIMDSKQKDF